MVGESERLAAKSELNMENTSVGAPIGNAAPLVDEPSAGLSLSTQAATHYWATRHAENAEEWCRHYWQSTNFPHRAKILDALFDLGPFGTLLEIGSHVGPNLRRIRERFPVTRLVGMDVNLDAVAYGRRFGQEAGLEGVSLFQAKIPEDLAGLPTGAWDIVLSCYCFAYFSPEDVVHSLIATARLAKRAVVLLEPMAPEGTGSMQCADLPEWRHDYEGLAQHWPRSLSMHFTPISPPADRLDGCLVVELEHP